MSKKLETTQLESQLKKSAFFRKSNEEPKEVKESPTLELETETVKTEVTQRSTPVKEEQIARTNGSNERTADTTVRTNVLVQQITPKPKKRRPQRYAFQFWEDQIIRIKKLKDVLNVLRDPDEQDEIGLSDLVKEALDEYLEKRIEQLSMHVRAGKLKA